MCDVIDFVLQSGKNRDILRRLSNFGNFASRNVCTAPFWEFAS